MPTIKKYSASWFIRKFKKIHESRWTTGSFEYEDKYCALGFCGHRMARCDGEDLPTEQSEALQDLFVKYKLNVVGVNDAPPNYLNWFGSTPKERILTALTNIKYLEDE